MNTARAQKKATDGSKGNASRSNMFIAPKQAKKNSQKATDDKKSELFIVPKTESAVTDSKTKKAKGKDSSGAKINEKKPTTNLVVAKPATNNVAVGKGKETKKEAAKEAGKPKGKEAEKKEYIVIKTPSKPEKDKAFQDTLKHIEGAKKEQQTHPKSETKAQEVKEAAVLPVQDQQQVNDRATHYANIEATSKEASKKKFTAASFKESLKKELDTLESNLPTTEAGAEEFKKDKPLDKVKGNVGSSVTEEKDKIAGPLATNAKEKTPPKSSAPTTEAKTLPVDTVGKAPKPINQKAATVKPKHKTEISMEKESDSLDDFMGENKITDSQLANANEPKFTEALDSKTKAQEEAKKAPQKYRNKENVMLGDAKTNAGNVGQEKLGGMFTSRSQNFTNVLSTQNTNESADKLEQKRINTEFTKIYDKTKEAVGARLDKISTDVDVYFDEGGEVEKAKKSFETRVEKKLGDIYGWTTIDDSIASFFTGSDVNAGAIEGVFQTEKKNFIDKLDKIFDKIATLIATGLNESMTLIETGRKEMDTFYKGLDKKQQELAKDSLEIFNDKYTDLEETVASKEQELAQDLAKQYKENVDSLRATFDEIKERVSSSWLEAAFNFLKGIVETILKIKDMLFTLIAALVDAITAIITDPIGFLKNLFMGIKLGFEYFFANIKTHLITGLIEWLTGSLGGVGITIPDNLFSLKGIFNLVMQILGLTWDYFRSKAVKLLGEPVVEGMEKAVEIFTIVKEKGVEGLWEHVKEQFNDLKEVVMDAIRDMVITKVVEAGIKWIMGLMSPAGAFVKAAMLIIDVIRFFVERAAQIFELVTAFIDGIRALAAGGIETLAKSIEKALAKTLPILIGFLAALVGITGLTGKVQKIIKRIRKRIDKAIDKVIKKAKKAFKGLVKKGKAKVKGAVGKVIQWWKKKKKFKTSDGEKHTLYFKGEGEKAKLMRASKDPKELTDFLASLKLKSDDPRKEKETKAIALGKEIKLITRTGGVSGKAENTDPKKEKEIVKKMTELSVLLVDLVGLSTADTPASADWKFTKSGGKKRAQVDELSHKTATGGGAAAGDTPEMTFVQGRPWVRMHLIANSIGGKGKIANWVPAPIAINSGDAVLHSFEKSSEDLVRSKAIPKSAGVREKAARPEQPNVIWVDVRVITNHKPKPEYDNLEEFPQKILFKYGVYLPPKPGQTKWQKVAKALSTQYVEVDPPPTDSSAMIINSKAVGRTEMLKSGNSHFKNAVYGAKLMIYIKAVKPFTTWEELDTKLKAKNAKARGTELNDTLIETIITDLKADTNITIK